MVVRSWQFDMIRRSTCLCAYLHCDEDEACISRHPGEELLVCLGEVDIAKFRISAVRSGSILSCERIVTRHDLRSRPKLLGEIRFCEEMKGSGGTGILADNLRCQQLV